MITDVVGRVRNHSVPMSKPLLPLFEAINNSIQAIEDDGIQNGEIDVIVIRDKSNPYADSHNLPDRQLADIDTFQIIDNGIGFNDFNFQAFTTSDTTSKAKRGGKGVGRFSWLVAFDTAEIESTYKDNGNTKHRQLTFCMEGDGIKNHNVQEVPNGKRRTVVRLISFKEKYQKKCPKQLDTIAAYIVEEFLDVFLGPTCPKITLRDDLSGESIDLDNFYEAGMIANSEPKKVEIKKNIFNVLNVRLYTSHFNEHSIYLCANGRVVTREKLSGIPNLTRRLKDDNDKDFVYAVYVNADLLDESVNSDRTGFSLSPNDSSLYPDDVTIPDIKDAIRQHCKEYLSHYTQPIAEKKKIKIIDYISSEGAMYRPLLKRLEQGFDNIDPDATNSEIDIYLYKEYQGLQLDLQKEGQELLNASVKEDDLDKFKTRFDDYFEKISEIKRADLARYVCHRKAIIEFLKNQLARQENGKYRLEDRIHSIIFPLGKTSDDILFSEHNLWLIDERLAFHVYLSSDRSIKSADPLCNESKKEPDIIIFDKAIAFSESTDIPFSSITIIEFKKPQRNDYSENENPFTQVEKYIDDIRKGKAKHNDGTEMPTLPNIPIYCYVICSLTDRLDFWARHANLHKTPDNLGYFGYKDAFGAYFEVISYPKLVADSEKRNQAFFHHLGIPKGCKVSI